MMCGLNSQDRARPLRAVVRARLATEWRTCPLTASSLTPVFAAISLFELPSATICSTHPSIGEKRFLADRLATSYVTSGENAFLPA